MSEELVTGYVDRKSFASDTEFIKQQAKIGMDAIDAVNAARLALQGGSTFKGFGEGAAAGDKALKDLQLTTANYQKILTAVAAEVGTLTDAQKEQLKVINEQYKSEEVLRQGSKETVKLIQNEIAQNSKLEAGRSNLAKTNAITNQQLKAEKLERDRLAKVIIAENNSTGKAQAIIDLLINKKIKLNLETEQGRRVNEAYNKTIEKQNAFILANADVETKRVKNIGNYSKSAQLIVDALEKERKKLEELEKTRIRVQNAGAAPIKGFAGQQSSNIQGNAGGGTVNPNFAADAKEATIEAEKLEEQIKQTRTVIEGFTRVTSQPQFLNVAGKVGDATAEVKFFTKALIDLERNGLGNSAAANDLRKNLAQLTDDIADARAEVKALSSDTRGMDLFAGSVSFAADAMQTFAGAAVLAGASEEDVAEQTRTLVAIQSVANGVKGIANELTTRGTAANKVYAFAQAQVAIATNAAATATARWAAALFTVGIGALIIGIGLLIANYKKIKEALIPVNQAQEDFIAINKAAAESAGAEITSLKTLRSAIEDVSVPMKTRLQAIKDIRKEYPEYFKGLTNEQILAGNVGAAYDLATAAILRKARANAAAVEIEKLVSANLQIELNSQLKATETNAKIQKTRADASVSSGGTAGGGGNFGGASKIAKQRALRDEFNEQKEADAKAIAANNERINFFLKFANAGAAETIKIEETKEKKVKKVSDDGLKDRLDAEKKQLAALRAIQIADVNERIRINQKIVDNPSSSFKEQIIALQNIDTLKKALAAEELSNAIANEKEIQDGKIVIISKSNEEIQLAEKQHEIAVGIINEESLAAQQAAQKVNSEKIIEQLEKDRLAKLTILEKENDDRRRTQTIATNEALRKNTSRFANGDISQKEYEATQERIQAEKQLTSLQAEARYQQQLVDLSTATTEEKAAASEKLAELDKDIADAALAYTKKREDEKRAAIETTLNKLGSVANQVFGLVSGILDANATRQKNALQDQRDEIEKTTAAQIEAVNASTLSEQDKAAKIAIINAKAATDKEKLARKERQIQIDQARFEKSVTIFNIILSTALNVAKALTPFGKVVAAISGAAQLAIAIATPIPKFFKGKGKGNNYEGPALINDHPDGRTLEVLEHADGSIEMPTDRNIVRNIKSTDIIHPDANAWMAAILGAAHRDAGRGISVKIPVKEDKVGGALALQTQLLKQIANKKEFSLGASDRGMVALHKWGANQVKYFQENTNW